MQMPTVKAMTYAACALIVTLAISQFVPYGHERSNPPILKEPTWNSSATRVLAKRACFDCHSNETAWPWYSRVAPVSWLIQRDVVEGRRALNFSEWQDGMREGENPQEIREEVAEGEMPPLPYTLIHPTARLTSDERQQLADGLAASAQQVRR